VIGSLIPVVQRLGQVVRRPVPVSSLVRCTWPIISEVIRSGLHHLAGHRGHRAHLCRGVAGRVGERLARCPAVPSGLLSVRATLQRLHHSRQVGDGEPEGAGAHPALPDAQDRHSGVRVPAEPHAAGIAPYVEENLAQTGQRGSIRCGHGAHGYAEAMPLSTLIATLAMPGPGQPRHGALASFVM
jgi:hypothetical protein